MHEYSLIQQVVASIQAQLGQSEGEKTTRINKVMLKVGMLDIHTEEAFRQAFNMLVIGTPMEHAVLELEIMPARIACAACGYQGNLALGQADAHDPDPYLPCPACGAVCAVQGGHGVESIELSVENME